MNASLWSIQSYIHILTDLNANDVYFISIDRHKIYQTTYGTVSFIFVEIQPSSMNIKKCPSYYVA